MSSTLGRLFRVTTFGESHGPAVGAVIDGCPPGLSLDEAVIQAQLDRRRPGQGDLTTARSESDQVEILSGVQSGLTLGTPIALLVRNEDRRPADYAALAGAPRPSHADFTVRAKYGVQPASGGGRASARETVGRVAAGAVAAHWLGVAHGVGIVAWVEQVAGLGPARVDAATVTRADVDAHPTRCPDAALAPGLEQAIRAARADGDSVGGVIAGVCRDLPAGWGEPVFDKLEAMLARAFLSLPATKGFEIGSGFAGTARRGSQNNDVFVARGSGLGTATNNSGGVQGGISNGEPVTFRVAFKPPASLARPQRTAGYDGAQIELSVGGRHDPCVLPRAVPIVEAMAALVLADLALIQASRGPLGGR
ncbi:MAG: chorismate synthase [bacterium]|nr:chorismate synthase [bacterium]